MIVNLANLKKAAIVLAAAGTLGAASIVSAQGPVGGPAAAVGRFSPMVCSTTNYTDVAAKALGMQAPALRQALVSGKTLDQIASSQNVTLQTVQTALSTAFQADLDQALKDGLITQQAYDQLKNRLSNMPGNAPTASGQNATPPATQNAPQGNRPQGRGFGAGPGLGMLRILGVSRNNQVNQFVVAAKALNMSCADMVKAMATGQSIAQIAATKNVQAQAVIDALVSAEKAAITQDVQEGLIGQAQADGRIAQLTNRAGAFVYSSGRRGMGGPGGMPGGRRGPGNLPGNPANPGDAPQPPAPSNNPDANPGSSS